MTTYKEIFGKQIKNLSSDPPAAISEGQIWYNTSSNAFKTTLPVSCLGIFWKYVYCKLHILEEQVQNHLVWHLVEKVHLQVIQIQQKNIMVQLGLVVVITLLKMKVLWHVDLQSQQLYLWGNWYNASWWIKTSNLATVLYNGTAWTATNSFLQLKEQAKVLELVHSAVCMGGR